MQILPKNSKRKVMTLMLRDVVNIEDVLSCAVIAKAMPVAKTENSGVKVTLLDGEYPFHSHDVDEVFVILDGELTMDFEGLETKPLKAGDVLTVPAGQRHRTRTIKPSKVLLVGPK